MHYNLDVIKLMQYGFIPKNEELIFKKVLKNDFFVILKYSNNTLLTEVYDEYSEKFLPYNVKNNFGKIVCEIREEVDSIINDIVIFSQINKFYLEDLKIKIKSLNSVLVEKPWEKYPDYETYKINGKWFAILMKINSAKLNLNFENDVHILNIKLEPNEINNLIDNIHYFKAYHMNKKNWITILLDETIDIEKVYLHILESYNLVLNLK